MRTVEPCSATERNGRTTHAAAWTHLKRRTVLSEEERPDSGSFHFHKFHKGSLIYADGAQQLGLPVLRGPEGELLGARKELFQRGMLLTSMTVTAAQVYTKVQTTSLLTLSISSDRNYTSVKLFR